MSEDGVSNPYQAPANPADALAYDDGRLFYREGEFLVVREGAELPNRCIHTNEEVPPDGWRKRKTVTWTPPWVFVTILLHFVIMLILALVFQKKAKIVYSLSEAARNRLIRRRAIWLGVFVAGVVIGFGGGLVLKDELWLIAIIAVIVVAIVGLVGSLGQNALTVKRHDKGRFTVKGCGREFLDSLPY